MVTLTEEKKRGAAFWGRIVLFLLFAILIVSLAWWFISIILAGARQTEAPSPKFREVKIDFNFLESQALQELQPFEKIAPLEGEAGRENPFLPY